MIDRRKIPRNNRWRRRFAGAHPAVIVARTGTTKAAHMLDNIGGGIGRLPNEAMRKRMAQFVDALPRGMAPERIPLERR